MKWNLIEDGFLAVYLKLIIQESKRRIQQVPPVIAAEYFCTCGGLFREERTKRSGNTVYTRLLVFIMRRNDIIDKEGGFLFRT